MIHRTVYSFPFWLVLVLMAGTVLWGIVLLFTNPAEAFGPILAGGLVLVGIWAFAWPITYELADTRLVIRLGRVTTSIDYERIVEVKPGTIFVAAYGWGLDRLHIAYEKPNGKTTFVLVTPEDNAAFTAQLAERAALRVEGDRLLR